MDDKRFLQFFFRVMGFVILQALIYATVSILCIYYASSDPDVNKLGENFLSAVYWRFLVDNGDNPADLGLTSIGFLIAMILYLPVDLYWAYTAYRVISNVHAKKKKLAQRALLRFTVCTLVITMCDVIFIFYIGFDYNKECYKPKNQFRKNLCQNAVLPMLFIVARGFVVWIFNFLLGGILTLRIQELKSKEKDKILARMETVTNGLTVTSDMLSASASRR